MSNDRVLIIGSDGLWDCVDCNDACDLVLASRRLKRSAAEDLVDKAISIMPYNGVTDNVSAIVVFFSESETK